MKSDQVMAKLERMVSADIPRLTENFFAHQGNTYYLFERYQIQNQRGLWSCTKHLRDSINFGHLPSAVAWCIADKHNQHSLAIEIRKLDEQVTMIQQDIDVRRGLRNHMRQETMRETVDLKIQHRQRRLRGLMDHLNKSINRAKYLQIRGFNNEAARTGRPASNRTY